MYLFSFEQAILRSDLIVESEVKNIEFHKPDSASSSAYADIKLSVKDLIKGESANEIIMRTSMVYEVDGKFEYIDPEHLPILSKNKRYILCLIRSKIEGNNHYWLIGSFTCTFEIENGMIINRDIIKEPFESVVENGTPVEDLKKKIKNILDK